MIRSTKDLKIEISDGDPASLVTLAGSNATNAAPSVITTTDTTGAADDDVIVPSGIGFSDLDDKLFTIANITVDTSFELLGSDASGEAAASTATSSFTVYPAASLIGLCLSSIGVNTEAPASVSTATFCDPNATVPGTTASAGTLDLGGYLDTADLGYAQLVAAAEDGNERVIKITLPGTGNGFLLARGTISSFSLSDIPIDGAIAFTAVFTLASKMVHRY